MEKYETEDQIHKVVEGFESCTTDKEEFTHLHHLTIAVCYLQNSRVAEATERLKNSLLRFVDHHGVDRQKYNETITVFWLELVAKEIAKLPESSLVEQCNAV